MESSSKGSNLSAPIDIDEKHTSFAEFAKDLQNAALMLFPNTSHPYRSVSVLLLYWEFGDAKLPVLKEVKELDGCFQSFGFTTELYAIPQEKSHNKLNRKILDFVEDGTPNMLRIVYYGGHGILGENRQLVWNNHPPAKRETYRDLKWAGIQNVLEEALCDVLILLDCCHAGTANSNTGSGVTEVIAATTFRHPANGVGMWSFTRALIDELSILRDKVHSGALPRFTTGLLYNNILRRLQLWVPRPIERQYSPVHVVLSQDQRYPRSIQLQPFAKTTLTLSRLKNGVSPDATNMSAEEYSYSDASSSSIPSVSSAPTTPDPFVETPLLRLEISLAEDLKAKDLELDPLSVWLRSIPVVAASVRVEALFRTGSSLLILTVPAALHAYLPRTAAIVAQSFVLSRNLLLPFKDGNEVTSLTTKTGTLSSIDVAREKKIAELVLPTDHSLHNSRASNAALPRARASIEKRVRFRSDYVDRPHRQDPEETPPVINISSKDKEPNGALAANESKRQRHALMEALDIAHEKIVAQQKEIYACKEELAKFHLSELQKNQTIDEKRVEIEFIQHKNAYNSPRNKHIIPSPEEFSANETNDGSGESSAGDKKPHNKGGTIKDPKERGKTRSERSGASSSKSHGSSHKDTPPQKSHRPSTTNTSYYRHASYYSPFLNATPSVRFAENYDTLGEMPGAHVDALPPPDVRSRLDRPRDRR